MKEDRPKTPTGRGSMKGMPEDLKSGEKGEGVRFSMPDHPDHSNVKGDGGKGCKP